VIGVANVGGALGEKWIALLLEALEAGLDIISGMHGRLRDIGPLNELATGLRRRLIDVRVAPANIPIATGRKRSGKRLLTVGSDCAVGKKYSALTLTRELRARGLPVDFRATGQTGILIAGSGIPMDAVVSDFEAGAAEMLSPDAPATHWDIIEGQGSLFHPAYAAVSLGLLHGSQPDVLVVCHTIGRERMLGAAEFSLPGVEETIELNLRLGRRTNPKMRCAGVCLNTASLTQSVARARLAQERRRLGLPVADPMRGGPELTELVEACLR
jgi:uncharacterized NAD-dependent epimerase/dehydratase family protein